MIINQNGVSSEMLKARLSVIQQQLAVLKKQSSQYKILSGEKKDIEAVLLVREKKCLV